jgi:serine O-acetyltransferase
MRLEISRDELAHLVAKQLGNFFLYSIEKDGAALDAAVDRALERCSICFGRTPNKYYQSNGGARFSPWHSGQYSIFLYFVSNAISRQSKCSSTLADRVYYLNKALNGLDLFHEITMPDFFMLDHPVGSVLGRADYGEGFAFSQNCTVGNNRGFYPKIGKNVRMMSGSKILGNCQVGDNVILAANSYIKDTDIPSCSLVFGQYPNHVIKAKDAGYFVSDS